MSKTEEAILKLPYYTPGSIEKESFVMIPAVMLPQPLCEDDPDYDPDWDNILSKMSSDEKILYALMRNRMLEGILANLRNLYDYVIIDCMPSLGMLAINALTCADFGIEPFLKCTEHCIL